LTDKELVVRKLTLMLEHIERARRRRPDDLEALRADVDRQDALVMSLLVALQEAADIAFHIAADEGWGVAASNAEAFTLLAGRAVIDPKLGNALATTVRLRNRIAHGYATLDLERIWQELPDGLAQLERYGSAITRWMETLPS
jgi:uncharacterized protein YutE (UPF0331/DUF86 family)